MIDFTLRGGINMPAVGLGVYKTLDPQDMQMAVDAAIEAGYRSFDTAQMYANEALLGQALQRNGIARQEIFLTSKVDLGNMNPVRTRESVDESRTRLATDYLDLLLVHWPGQSPERLLDTWRTMMALQQVGKVRAIGVCNCAIKHLEWIANAGLTMPVINQVERHPFHNPQTLADWCQVHDIRMEAWAPLARGRLNDPLLLELAQKYGKTPAQIILRWDVQGGYIVIPKSVHPARIRENIDIFDFALSDADMQRLDHCPTSEQLGRDIETFDF